MPDNPAGQGSPGSLTPVGFPDVSKYGLPTMNKFLPKSQEQEQKEAKEKTSRHQDVRMIYRDLVSKGMHPKDAAKQAQAMTGHSAVTGAPIKRELKISKKTGKVIVSQPSGKARARFSHFGRS